MNARDGSHGTDHDIEPDDIGDITDRDSGWAAIWYDDGGYLPEEIRILCKTTGVTVDVDAMTWATWESTLADTLNRAGWDTFVGTDRFITWRAD